jgi:hypothetical protein
MSFEKRRFGEQEHVYRGIEEINKKTNPRSARVKCFYRRPKDTDGVTVLPDAHLCCRLRIVGIARLTVEHVNRITNPVTGDALAVYQDAPDHGYISNVPFKHEHLEAAEDVATRLAEKAVLLGDREYEDARQTASADRQQAPGEEPQESFRWGPE